MALSDKRIKEEMEKGDIIISPFDERNLSTSSYDVTLGAFYYRQRKPKHPDEMFSIYSEEQTRNIWGEPQFAIALNDPSNPWMVGFNTGLNEDDRVIFLAPGETILGHTQEYIGGRGHITTMMKARSSMGRQGILVCKCAGWGDVGYINRWTMEITNSSKFTIPLVVGRRIAQIVFFETGPILAGDYTEKGNYAASNVLAELEKTWQPQDMLPKMWKDRDIKR